MKAVILLYYRAPYSSGTTLVCACDEFNTARKKAEQLSKEHPDLYSFTNRFEFVTVELVTKEDQ